MKAKLGSVLVAVVGALMTMKGMGGDLTWGGFLDLFTGAGGPMVVLGMILVIWRAYAGDKQMVVPKKLGKKP